MRNGVAPKWWTMSVVQAGELGRSLRLGGHRALGAPLVARRPHESCEQRVRARGARLELGMELAPDEPGMVRQLDHLDQRAIGREARAAHPVFRQHVARSEEHTSELQSQSNIVCRLLLEKKYNRQQ